MKKVATIATSLLLTLGISSHAAADAGMPKYLETQLVSVCHALKSNNKLRLNSIIKRAHFDYQDIAEGLRCNGQTAHEFAMYHGANGTADLLARRAGLNVNEVLAKR